MFGLIVSEMPICLHGGRGYERAIHILKARNQRKEDRKGVRDKMPPKDSLHVTCFFQLDPTA